MSLFKQIILFLKQEKKWWLIPLAVMALLAVLALLLLVSSPGDFLDALSIEVETVTKEKKWAWKKPGPRKILRFQQRHALENPMG